MGRQLRGAEVVLLSVLFSSACAAQDGATAALKDRPDRAAALRNCFGTYAAPPRGDEQRVDVAALLDELEALQANSYNWLIGQQPTDWEDLQRFLPKAQAQGVRVWATLLPPSESKPGHYSEPFQLDYMKWADAIGTLSRREPALVAWSIDDFAYNRGTYTPQMTQEMVQLARSHNPRLAFVPCLYFSQMSEEFARQYQGSFDGILFPFRNESVVANLTDPTQVAAEVERVREWYGPDIPVIIDVYAFRHSRLGDSTPEYVRDVMASARGCADGVMIYRHLRPATNQAKYDVVHRLFHLWATQ